MKTFSRTQARIDHATDFVPLVQQLEAQLGILLMARTETDTVDGHVNVSSSGAQSNVEVVLYDQEDAQKPKGGRKSTFRDANLSDQALRNAGFEPA